MLTVNVVVLAGEVATDPVWRRNNEGYGVLELRLSVPEEGRRMLPLPVTVDEARVETEIKKGDYLLVHGKVARRFYRSGAGARSLTEIVADGVKVLGQTAGTARTDAAPAVGFHTSEPLSPRPGGGLLMDTPWGESDSEHVYADGIVFYGTPSHGGFKLDGIREDRLEEMLMDIGLTTEQARMGYEPGWYEEDCCALAVLMMWPELFADESRTPRNVDSGEQADAWLQSLLYWVTR
jgi:single-stranded DNA-binding protein